MPAWSCLAKSSSDRTGSSATLATAGLGGSSVPSGFLLSIFTVEKSSSISKLEVS